MTPQERVADAAKTGSVADFTGESDPLDAEFLAGLFSGRDGVRLHPKGPTINKATITGSVDWTGWRFLTSVALTNCVFKAPITARRLRIDGDFSLEGSKVVSIDMIDARVEGDLRLSRVIAQRDDDPSNAGVDSPPIVDLNSVRVDGSLILERMQAIGEVRLLGADIRHQMACYGAKLQNPNGEALSAANVRVGSDVLLGTDKFVRDPFEATGAVSFVGAKILGQLACVGIHIIGMYIKDQGRFALLAENADIAQDVILINGFEATGAVSFSRARIGGLFVCDGAKLNCDGAQIRGTESIALSLDRAEITKGFVAYGFLDQGLDVEGAMDLSGAVIGGHVVCSGADIRNGRGSALIADNAKVTGDVSLTQGRQRKGFAAAGEVSFRGLEVGGSLFCRGASFSNPQGTAFNGEEMTIRNGFEWTGVRPVGHVNLTKAGVGQLRDDMDSWPHEVGDLQLTGFTYEQFGKPGAEVSVKKRLEWLRLQTKSDYTPQPYVQLAQVLKNAGRDDDARDVLVAKQTDLRRFGHLSLAQKSWNWLLGLLIGHGYKPLRALIVLLVLYVSSVTVTWIAMDRDAFIPVGSAAVGANLKASSCAKLQDKYPCLFPPAYALDAAVPALNLHEVDYWKFNVNTTWGQIGRDWLDLATVLSWVFVTLLIVGVTGLIREK